MKSLLLWGLLWLAAAPTAEEWQKEIATIKAQAAALKQTAATEEIQYQQQVTQKQKELQQLLEKQLQVEQEINTNQLRLQKLREQELRQNPEKNGGEPLGQLAQNWQQWWHDNQLRQEEGLYYTTTGEPHSGKLFLVGNWAAFGLDKPVQPLEKSARGFKAATVRPHQFTSEHIFPLPTEKAHLAPRRTFRQYMADGGILAWPIFGLGCLVLFISGERLLFFIRNRNKKNLSPASLQRFRKTLALLATAAPLLGLLGTVLGIMEAFDILALASHKPNPATLSGAIAEALITTELGLIVALMALFVHHLLVSWGQKYEQS